MISPLPLIEVGASFDLSIDLTQLAWQPEIVADGRQEIYDCWVAGRKDENPDQDALLDAIFGALELGFNQNKTSIVNACVHLTRHMQLI